MISKIKNSKYGTFKFNIDILVFFIQRSLFLRPLIILDLETELLNDSKPWKWLAISNRLDRVEPQG